MHKYTLASSVKKGLEMGSVVVCLPVGVSIQIPPATTPEEGGASDAGRAQPSLLRLAWGKVECMSSNKAEAGAPSPQVRPNDESSELPLRNQAAHWSAEHTRAAEELSRELSPPDATASERALSRAAAHDLALLQELEGTEVALAHQIQLLIASGRHKNGPMLIALLTDVSRVRSEASRRATELLKATEALAVRRELAAAERPARPHLRRVG